MINTVYWFGTLPCVFLREAIFECKTIFKKLQKVKLKMEIDIHCQSLSIVFLVLNSISREMLLLYEQVT